jgi:hypothetical protein
MVIFWIDRLLAASAAGGRPLAFGESRCPTRGDARRMAERSILLAT